MRHVTIAERRRLLVRRHHLAADATGPEQVTDALVALHATDPASVYLSVLARSAGCTLSDVAAAMYERRSLVRWLAMRRTLFVFPRPDVPMVQAAVSDAVAAGLHVRLANRLARNGTEPALDAEPTAWIEQVCRDTEQALQRLGSATGAQLSTAQPRLRTTIRARLASERPQTVTSTLLTLLGAKGTIVRGAPIGAWTTRQHRWEPVDSWWPDGLPRLDPGPARAALAGRYLARFGPATVEDLQWWTGWNQTDTRRALEQLGPDEVDLHGSPGVALASERDDAEQADDGADPCPVAVLLPALDPTPMGWKRRDWFFDLDPRELFDRAGNIGPTVWWDGRVIGSWAVARDGEVRTLLRSAPCTAAVTAVQDAAQLLQSRLDGAVVTPAARTPLERSLVDS